MRYSSKVRLWPVLLVVAFGTTACGNGGGFGGSAKSSASTPDQPPVSSQDASIAKGEAAAPTGAVASTSAAQANATTPNNGDSPGQMHDVSKTGFQCPKDMNLASGAWNGTYKGAAVANLVGVQGTVAFTMHPSGPTSLQVGQLSLAGGLFGGDQVRSVAIDFQMNCGDLALHDAVVSFMGKNIHVKLAFSAEGWNPPAFQGTWIAQTEVIPIEVARGTWSVGKK